MAENQKKIEFLTQGSTVEVRMEGAWYEADVVAQCADPKDWFRVLCSNISTRYVEKLMDFNISSLRPRPPPPPPPQPDRSFELRDVVDVLVDYGWWNGVVSGVYTLRGEPGYTVALFENPHMFADQIFTSERLRSHQVWTDDAEWVRPAKSKEIPGQGEESSTLQQYLNPVTSTGRSNRNKGFLSEGSTVEVRMGEAWYEADIVTQCPKSEGVFRVLTVDIERWWYDKRLRNIHMSLIRPRPPPREAGERYEPCEVVDVLHRGGWRKGVVSGGYIAKGKPKYTVVLSENIPEVADKIFASHELRLHWDWTDNSEWVRPHKLKEILGLEEQSSTLDKSNSVTETSTGNALNTSEPETAKKFRKENHVISSAPQESQPASMAMTSTCDVGINLAMKGKTGLAKSSKKRPREPDAHIMNQVFLAADNTNDESTEIARNEDFPFKKSSYLWKEIDSLEVFRMLPQNPHFSLLKDCNEDTREGTAIGHMWNFASLVEKVSKLRIEDPGTLFQRYLEALAVLETVGFDVKAVVDRINKLLAFKTEQERLNEMFEVEAGTPW